MRTRPLAVALLVSLSAPIVLPPRIAVAQSTDDATTKMARQRFQEGVAYFDKGQFEMARAAFLQAYALRKHPAVLLNLAQSALKSGHTLEAAHYFQQFLKEHTAATDAQRADANRGLNEARNRLGRIDVVGAPSGAEIFVDDERVGVAPLDHSIDVEPGTHTVRAHGATDQALQVTAGVGQGVPARFSSASAPVAVAPAPAPQPAPSPPAEEPPPPAPAEPTPAPPAEASPEAIGATPAATEGGGRSRWGWVVAGGALTVGSFATAIIMGVVEKQSAQSSADTASGAIADAARVRGDSTNGLCVQAAADPKSYYHQACQALATDDNNVNTDATIANIAIGVGAAAATFTILYAVFGTKNSPSSSNAAFIQAPVVTPMMGRGLAGATLSATF